MKCNWHPWPYILNSVIMVCIVNGYFKVGIRQTSTCSIQKQVGQRPDEI
jgi:hypothetical protein